MNNHCISNILSLPDTSNLRDKLQSLAILDAILMQDWEMRYFSFNSKWGPKEMTGSMRDGQGSEFFFLFNPVGVAGKIYCKEEVRVSDVSSILARVPNVFSSFLNEAAFSINIATYYLWRQLEDSLWSIAPDRISEIPFLAFVVDQGEYYSAWAESYYEIDINRESVNAVFRHEPLTNELIASLNPEMEISTILVDCQEIGYPSTIST